MINMVYVCVLPKYLKNITCNNDCSNCFYGRLITQYKCAASRKITCNYNCEQCVYAHLDGNYHLYR